MGSEKLEASGGRPEVRELLLSLPSVGERGSFAEHNYAFMLSFYVLGFILRLFIVFLQKKILSTYCLRTVIETCLRNGVCTLIIFFFLNGNIMCARATQKNSFVVLR